eukprot:SAG22_NODE_688_length_7907_cov_7.557505_6_plen_1038_part_00
MIGHLEEGQIVQAIQSRPFGEVNLRLQLTGGWASTKAADGTKLLTRVRPSETEVPNLQMTTSSDQRREEEEEEEEEAQRQQQEQQEQQAKTKEGEDESNSHASGPPETVPLSDDPPSAGTTAPVVDDGSGSRHLISDALATIEQVAATCTPDCADPTLVEEPGSAGAAVSASSAVIAAVNASWNAAVLPSEEEAASSIAADTAGTVAIVQTPEQLAAAAEAEIQEELQREVAAEMSAAGSLAAAAAAASAAAAADASPDDAGGDDGEQPAALVVDAAEQIKAKRAEERAARRARFEQEKQRILETNIAAAEAAAEAVSKASSPRGSPKRTPSKRSLDPGSPSTVAIAAVNQRLQAAKQALQEKEEQERLLHEDEERKQRAAATVQASARGRRARLELRTQGEAATGIQSKWRGVQARRVAKTLAKERHAKMKRDAAAAKKEAAAAARRKERELKAKSAERSGVAPEPAAAAAAVAAPPAPVHTSVASSRSSSTTEKDGLVGGSKVDTRALAAAAGTLSVIVRGARTPKHWSSTISSFMSIPTAADPYVSVTVGEVTKMTRIAVSEEELISLDRGPAVAAALGTGSTDGTDGASSKPAFEPLAWPADTADWEEYEWGEEFSFAAGIGVIDEVGSKGLIGAADISLWHANTLSNDKLVGNKKLSWRPLLLLEHGAGAGVTGAGSTLSQYKRPEAECGGGGAESAAAAATEVQNPVTVWEHKACFRLHEESSGGIAGWVQLELRFTPWPWEMLKRPDDSAAWEAVRGACSVKVVFEKDGKLGINFSFPIVESIAPGGLAADHPELEPGLLLASVAGHDVVGLSQAEAFEFASKAGRPLTLEFLRVPWHKPPAVPPGAREGDDEAAAAVAAAAVAAGGGGGQGGVTGEDAGAAAAAQPAGLMGAVWDAAAGLSSAAAVAVAVEEPPPPPWPLSTSGSTCKPDPDRGAPPGSMILAVTAPNTVKLGVHFHRRSDPPFAVAKLSEGGLGASADGPVKLEPGCVLVAVGDTVISGMSYDEGLAVLKGAPRPVELRFHPPPTTEI